MQIGEMGTVNQRGFEHIIRMQNGYVVKGVNVSVREAVGGSLLLRWICRIWDYTNLGRQQTYEIKEKVKAYVLPVEF